MAACCSESEDTGSVLPAVCPPSSASSCRSPLIHPLGVRRSCRARRSCRPPYMYQEESTPHAERRPATVRSRRRPGLPLQDFAGNVPEPPGFASTGYPGETSLPEHLREIPSCAWETPGLVPPKCRQIEVHARHGLCKTRYPGSQFPRCRMAGTVLQANTPTRPGGVRTCRDSSSREH
jgi:hypothetical protein